MDYLFYSFLLLAGAFLGVVAMAIVFMSRPIDPEGEDNDDTELLDFVFRNDMGLHVIQQGDGAVMWGMATSNPLRRIGELAYDPRTAIENAMAAMEPEVANG